ncbi:transglutaminase-like domain-containing protein [Metamycoplasma hyosynoviae]|uniref:transglutaminase-like domain-containing protein n=1 Tax=Metamycoplasma hyosynoviae TaxID=29559 RepID=UPI0023662F14|nr:transglutaminase-like domain-containing protein [Metamycoplasma hyosynoviae]MDD7895032.1 transglutaminase-like domain-containing protein [Metamycoplasma hyosynoviae]
MLKSKKMKFLLMGSILPFLGTTLFSVSCNNKKLLENALKNAKVEVENKNKFTNTLKKEEIKITLNNDDFEVIDKSFEIKKDDETSIIVKFRIKSKSKSIVSEQISVEVNGFKDKNIPYSYSDLWNDINKDGKMYSLSSIGEIKFDVVDTTGLSPNYDRPIKREQFSPIKLTKEQLDEWYDKVFGYFYKKIETLLLYKSFVETKLTSLLTAYGTNATYFAKIYDEAVKELKDTMDVYNDEFKTDLDKLNKEGLKSEIAKELANKIEIQKGIFDKQYHSLTLTQNNILSRLTKLIVDPAHKYFKDEETKNKRLGKLKINQKLQDAKLDNVRQIFKEHKAESFTIEVDATYAEDFKFTSDVPKWLKDHLEENSIKYTLDPAKPEYTQQKFYEDYFYTSVFEIELGRQIYNLFGEGYFVDLTTLGDWELDSKTTPGKVLLNVKTQQWQTENTKQKELNEYVIKTLNEIIDDRWDDETKVEAVRNYLLYKLYYASEEELEKVKETNLFVNKLGLSLADPYNLIAGGSVVCDGYARAFSLFMYYLGIPSRYMGGIGMPTEDEDDKVAHAWNEVWLEKDGKGAWYPLDLTWDDGDEEAGKDSFNFYYSYFLQNVVNKVPFETSHKTDPVLKQFYVNRPTPLK